MRIRPVKTYTPPRYPQKDAVLADPDLLRRLPLRWQACRKAAAAAGLLAAVSLSGCNGSHPPDVTISAISDLITFAPAYAGEPLPPATVSEADALRIIREATGITASANTASISKPTAYLYFSTDNNAWMEANVEIGKIDAFNKSKHIGFEYLSGDTAPDNTPVNLDYTNSKVDQPSADTNYILLIDRQYAEKEQAEANLKEQIKSFLDWLKAEGIGD